MDDRQKTRIVMLGISGILGCTGWYGYVWYQDQKAAQQEEEQVPIANVRQPIRRKPVETVANTTTPDTSEGTVKPAVAITETKTTPVQAAVTTPVTVPATKVAMVPPPVVIAPPVVAKVTPPVAVKPAVVVPPVNTAVAAVRPQPAMVPPAVTPVTTAAATPGVTPPVAAALPATGPAPIVLSEKEQYLATTMAAAAQAAAAIKGRPEPTRPVDKYDSWPAKSTQTLASGGKQDPADLLALVPPPPPPEKMKPKKINEKLVPPPPPADAAAGGLAGLPIDQLPVPPSRPTIGDKLKVLGVFDDRAIISFPKSLQIKNKWPRTISLGTGEQFESLTIVSINRDGVTIEEDGERSMKPISAVK
jgi:hypothetical protein